MRSEQEMANGQYFDYGPNQSYAPDSPDTFFAQVNVQPPTSDSNQTPPSPTYSKPRRSVARPSQAHASSNQQSSNSYSVHRTSKSSREPSSRFRRERERQLANTPREALIQLVIVKEHEYTEAKHLLTTAILQVESLKDRLAREENARKTLEEETRIMGLKTTKAILDSQNETMRSKEDIGYYKLQQQNTERQLRHANERLRVVEKERDEADRALVRARTTARQLKEDNVIYKAREEGRREGFEEGLRQGRLQQESPPAEGEGSEPKQRKKERKSSNPPGPALPTLEQEQALAALREIDEREKLRIRLQLSDIERKLDAERQTTKDLERLLKKSATEKSKLEQDKQKLEEERDQARRALDGLEREKEELKRRETEALKRASSDKRRLTEESEREKREILREKERAEREKRELEEKAREEVQRERERAQKAEDDRERDRERERERDREREREQREKDRETSATIAAATAAAVSAVVGAATSSHSSPAEVHDYRNQPYIPMPAPPVGAIPIDMPTPIVMPAPDLPSSTANHNTAVYPTMPRAGSSGSQRGYYGHHRRDSFSSAASTQFDILQLPDRERGLSVIPEDASVRAASPAWGSNDWHNKFGPSFPAPEVPNIVPRGGPSPGVGAAFPTPDIPNIIPKGVASGGVAFPVPEVPNIVAGGPASAIAGFPQPEIPNIVPKGGTPGPSGVAFPAPEVPNIVGRNPTPGLGSGFPEPEIPNIVPKGGYVPGGSGLEFPQPEIPNIVGRGGDPISGGGGAAFPTPEVPNIIPRGYTPGGGAAFPTPEVPNIIPKGTPGGYTPGGGLAFPNPEVPNIVGRGEGLSAGPSAAFPTPEVPNIIPKGGAVFPTPEIPNIVGKGGPGAPSPVGGSMFPTPEVPNIVGRASSSQGRHTPGSGFSFPTPEVPNIVGGAGPSPGSGAGLFPTPEVPNIIPKGATSGGIPFPHPEVPQIVPKLGSAGSGGFPTPHIPNIIPKGGAQFPTPEVPNIIPQGGSEPAAAFPTPVVPNIIPKGKKGKKGARTPDTPHVLTEGSASISRAVDFPTPEVPGIVPPKGASTGFGSSSPSWPSAQVPTNAGGTGWGTPSIPGDRPGGMPSSPYSNPALLSVNNSGLMRRPSIGSTGSYDVMIQPPSRPESRSGLHEQDRHWLSPNHSSIPLPKSQPRGGNGVPTQPNTPVAITGPLPPGFIPQTITDANGISTPIYQPNVLPPMGPPVIPPLSGSNIYKNPVNRDRDDQQPPSVFGGAGPVFPHSPAGSIKPLGTPGPVWGNMGGMTPGSTTRDLPGPASRGSIFGVASPSAGAPMSMPVPTVPNLDDDNGDFFDQNTTMNTKLNAATGSNAAAAKKKKKKR